MTKSIQRTFNAFESLQRAGFDDSGARDILHSPHASVYRIECALWSARLKGIHAGPKAVEHIRRFINRRMKVTEQVEAAVNTAHKKRRAPRPIAAAEVAALPDAPPAAPYVPIDVRAWARTKTTEQLERLRDEFLATNPNIDQFLRTRLETRPLTGRTESIVLMEFEQSNREVNA